MKEWIKEYYEAGYYDNDPASLNYIGYFVEAGYITEAEYKEITGSATYTPPVEA